MHFIEGILFFALMSIVLTHEVEPKMLTGIPVNKPKWDVIQHEYLYLTVGYSKNIFWSFEGKQDRERMAGILVKNELTK